MAASKNSGNSRRSDSGLKATSLCLVLCLVIMTAAVAWFYRTGATLYSGDAEAHLNIARRVIDSRTPGWDQLGTTWLPLPHLLMLPLVRNDRLWMTGLAGAIPAAIMTVLATAFLFGSLFRVFGGWGPAAVGAAVFQLNPNTLYLGSIPMTEPALYASLFALLYFTVRFGQTRGWGALVCAGVAAFAGTLTRYEAWILLPFVALYLWLSAPGRRWTTLLIFCLLAGAGPVLWLCHNWWYFADPLYFYRGPWSAQAIQGNLIYPGKGDWLLAARHYFEAGRLVAGLPGLVVAGAGLVFALFSRRAHWPLLLLLLPVFFYVWSIHSSGTPVYVPQLKPHGWYNVRYAMAFLPLVALGGAAIVSRVGSAAPLPVSLGIVLLALSSFLVEWTAHPAVWREAEINSEGRRAWTDQAVAFLTAARGPHETFFTSFGDLTPIWRTLGVPLRDTLTGDNNPQFMGAQTRPDLFLWEDWAVVMGGDTVQSVIDRARLHGPKYELSERIIVRHQPVIEIYRRTPVSPELPAP